MKRFALLSTVIAALGVALIAAGIAISGARQEAPFEAMSNQGTAVDPTTIASAERATLESAGIDAELHFLGERAGVRFYTGRSTSSGKPCFVTGLALNGQPHFGILSCSSGTGADDFPSANTPVLDYSPLKGSLTEEFPHVQWLAGFAADGVVSVGIVDVAGRVHETPVVDNVYATRAVPTEAASAIIALESDGQTVYTKELGGAFSGGQ